MFNIYTLHIYYTNMLNYEIDHFILKKSAKAFLTYVAYLISLPIYSRIVL